MFAERIPKWLPAIHWNFFRIHLTCFILVPLIVSTILYAGNAPVSAEQAVPQPVAYIDALFISYSACTTTGLVTVNLSSLRPFQQALLIVLAFVGDVTFVSWVMVLVRKRFFQVQCQELLARDKIHRVKGNDSPKVFSKAQISAPMHPEPLRSDAPERRVAESPTAISERISSMAPGMQTARQRSHHRRQTLRAKTLGRDTPGPSFIQPFLPPPERPQYSGLGGFPVLSTIGRWISRQRLPSFAVKTSPLLLTRNDEPEENWNDKMQYQVASWLPNGISALVIGRNGRFYSEELEDEELEQIGGVEYRALRFLSYFIALYISLSQLVPFAILAIYFAVTKLWRPEFLASAGVQQVSVNSTWASFYFAVSGYSGAGLTLVDQSLLPFSGCYTLIWVLNVVLLLGNHAFPMVLRCLIWLGSKCTSKASRRQTLSFLLEHPRRCFLYLFPSHQTWYLALALLAFIVVEMFSFLVLNIGLPVLDDIPTGWQKFSDGLIQSLSVRASGFSIVPITGLAPSTLFLYVVLMYIAIYPIALSVRSTNVYEEQSLGVFEADEPDEEPETGGSEGSPSTGKASAKSEVFSKYLLWHVRRQLAFDIWPLGLAIFVIACFERGKLLDERGSWFTLFRIIFECTSAYSLVGLSLGTPANNYSFCAEFTTPSKIVIILLMLRGRHRGLPVAIDRAIMLPEAFRRLES